MVKIVFEKGLVYAVGKCIVAGIKIRDEDPITFSGYKYEFCKKYKNGECNQERYLSECAKCDKFEFQF